MTGTGREPRVLAFVVLGLVATAILGWRLVDTVQRLHTRAGWTTFALCLAGAVLLGALVTGLALRRHRGATLQRRVAPVLAAAALVGLVALPTAAANTAELVSCQRGQGLEVAVTFTQFESRRGARGARDLLVGSYVVAGERHTLRVLESDRNAREVGPDRYRVPWAGSDRACGTARSSDVPTLVGYLLMTALIGTAGVAALVGAVRRWRADGWIDESGPAAGSDSA